MIRKFVAIALAVLINCAVLAWFHSWSGAVVASASQPRTHKVVTLPTITVYPARAQLEMLRNDHKPPITSSATPFGEEGAQTPVMPYYSFADDSGVARDG